MITVSKAENLEFLQKWWLEIHGHKLPEKCLPPNKFYVCKDGVPVGYFGMHGMECCICYLGFPTISNTTRRKEREGIFQAMCSFAKNWAKSEGYELIFLSIQGVPAQKNFMKNGFEYGDKEKGEINAKHLFMKV